MTRYMPTKAILFKQLCSVWLIVAMVGQGLPLDAKNRKGDKLLNEGRKIEAGRDFEKALELYEQALKEDAGDVSYQIAARRARFESSQIYVKKGQKLREAGNLEEALQMFSKAIVLDPSSTIALQELRRTKAMLDEEAVKAGKPSASTRGLTPAQRGKRESEERIASLMPVPELKPLNRDIRSLKMNNQTVRVMFETVGKLAGINVIFDPEYQQGATRNYSVDLANTTLEESLEYLSLMTKSYWKPLSSNAIFVTNDNIAKRRDHEENVVRVFYLNNVNSIQELQEAVVTVRSALEVRRMFTYNPQNAIVVRGTVDQMLLVEKLLADLDKPKAEIVIDVIVMETATGRTRDLIATLASGTTPGLNATISPTLGGINAVAAKDAVTSALTLPKLKNLTTKDFSVSLPSYLLSAVMADRSTSVKQSPQIRMADGMKGSLRVGDKVPTASGSFQPGIGSVGVSPLVNTQFQMIEVGVNVDITPRVVSEDEVYMHVEIEISNVKERIDIGGIKQPVIGQRKVIDDLRVREGEMSIIGGLVQYQDNKTTSGVPGLMNIPGLRRLFSSESIDRSQSELVIALVPHIVRSSDITASNLKGVASGFDQVLRVQQTPRKDSGAPSTMPAATPVDSGTAPQIPDGPRMKPAAAPVKLSFQPNGVVTKAGSPIVVSLHVEGADDLASTPMKIKYDPKRLKLDAVTPGAFLGSDGQRPNFKENVRNDDGEATITLSRLPGSKGLTGTGAILGLTFTTLMPGNTTVSVLEPSLKTSEDRPVPANSPSLNVEIR